MNQNKPKKNAHILFRLESDTKQTFKELFQRKGLKMSKLIEGFILNQIAQDATN